MSTILIESVYSGWAPELSSIRIYGLCLPASWGFPSGSVGKESACNAGDLGSIPGSGRSPGEGNGNPLQYSCLENSMDRGSGWLQFMGLQRVRHDCTTNIPFVFQHHTPVVLAATEIQRAPSAPKGRGVPVLPLSHCCFPLPSGPTIADLQSCSLLFGCHHCPCCAIWAALAVPCTSSVCCFLCLASFPFFSL